MVFLKYCLGILFFILFIGLAVKIVYLPVKFANLIIHLLLNLCKYLLVGVTIYAGYILCKMIINWGKLI